jgi:hypothetical protein
MTSDELVEEGQRELDLGSTKDKIWDLITLKGGPRNLEYESVIEFLEESIPKLKSKQQEDMRENLANRIYSMSQLI